MTKRLLSDEAPRLQAQIRLPSGGHIELSVLDVSLCGCMVERRAWSGKPEDRVLIKLPGLSFQPAAVLWVEDDKAGITFEQPLYEAVLAHLNQAMAPT